MLTRLRLENFKSWKDSGNVPLRPITGFFGTNSSGKTSLFQALLLMKQTVESPDRGILFHFGDGRTPVHLGDFESVINNHDTKKPLKFSVGWHAKRNIEIPKAYSSGEIATGDEVGFEVEAREGAMDSGKALLLEKMAYRIADRQRIGMRRLTGQMAYSLYADGSDFNFSHETEEDKYHLRPFKFHHFPFWAQDYFEDEYFPFHLYYGLELLLRDLYYLGPLRASPSRTYARSGAQPVDMGQSGEFVVDALLSSRERDMRIGQRHLSKSPAIDLHVASWLKRLGLVRDFRVEELAEGSRIFEVKVRKSGSSAEALLTDVGFGVSQILPVLVLCFYVPRGSTVLLEQPDIHLHPSVQAGLADVFIDAWKRCKVQILFESHSEHLLRRLQRRIAEGKIKEEDVSLFFCSAGESSTSSISHLEVDRLGNISNWPKDFFGDQFGEIAAIGKAALKFGGDSD